MFSIIRILACAFWPSPLFWVKAIGAGLLEAGQGTLAGGAAVRACASAAFWLGRVSTSAASSAPPAAYNPALPTLDTGWEYHTFRTDDGSALDPKDFIRLQVTEAP